MKPQEKNSPHKDECCRRWQKTEEKEKPQRKMSPINKEIETIQNMNRSLDEKNQKLKLLEETNLELNKKLIEFEVFYSKYLSNY